jgi:hypothetical protein
MHILFGRESPTTFMLKKFACQNQPPQVADNSRT